MKTKGAFIGEYFFLFSNEGIKDLQNNSVINGDFAYCVKSNTGKSTTKMNLTVYLIFDGETRIQINLKEKQVDLKIALSDLNDWIINPKFTQDPHGLEITLNKVSAYIIRENSPSFIFAEKILNDFLEEK